MRASPAAAAAPELQADVRETAAPRAVQVHAPLKRASALQMAQSVRASLRTRAQRLLRPDRPFGRAFENIILALIILSVASVILEEAHGLPEWAKRAFYIEEIVVVCVFSFEYLLRLVAAEKIRAFVFSFQGVVDLISIAPFYLVGVDARAVRALRFLRLLRVLKLQTHILENTVAERTHELADKNAALEQAQAQLKAELDVARALQIAILPATFPVKPGCDGAARMIPATTMGGDFYDFMAVARTNLRDLAARYVNPGACLAQTNEVLCTQNPMDLFVTVFYAVFDTLTGVLCYANG